MYSTRKRRAPWHNGVVWPDTGTDTPINVSDIFGGRTFPSHIPTVGYNYDHHRGVDIPLLEGDTYLAAVTSRVSRVDRSHFSLNTSLYQAYWTDDSDGYGTTWDFDAPGILATCTRGGSNSWPSVDKYQATARGVTMGAGAWELRVNLGATTAINGAFGLGMTDTLTSEHVMMEWDGVNVRCIGTSSAGVLANNNLTNTVTAGHTWLRVRSSGTALQLATSADGVSWTNKFTETNPTWTNDDQPSWRATMYYRSKDTNATADTVPISFVGWYDSDSIARFGNWVTLSREGDKFISLHFDDVYVEQGDYVDAADELGTVGLTGFDDRSGNIISPHVHIEWAPVSSPTYDNDESKNPLAAGIMPRVNVSNNVSAVITSEQDPDSVDSHKMVVTVTRADQDFDAVEFSLTGNTNTRTINWDTRSGLNPDNDIAVHNGVYLVASAFSSAASAYVITIYFNKSAVGSTVVSAYVKDTAGATLWSSP